MTDKATIETICDEISEKVKELSNNDVNNDTTKNLLTSVLERLKSPLEYEVKKGDLALIRFLIESNIEHLNKQQ